MFHNLKNYDAYLVLQECGKFEFKINGIPNGLEQPLIYISTTFLSSSLESLVKNVGENNFRKLNQEFDSKVLGLVNQKGFYPCEYIYDFEKFNKILLSKSEFYSSLSCKGISGKGYQNVLKI